MGDDSIKTLQGAQPKKVSGMFLVQNCILDQNGFGVLLIWDQNGFRMKMDLGAKWIWSQNGFGVKMDLESKCIWDVFGNKNVFGVKMYLGSK